MIRFLLLTFGPLLLPFAVWYLWRVFAGEPEIDPGTGEQVPPDFGKAPVGKLLLAGAVLMALTVGGFLLAHRWIAEPPYKPLSVDELEQLQNQQSEKP